MNLVKKLWNNGVVKYIFFGACATAVNLGTYAILFFLLDINMTTANVISIILAILFAYLTNKIFVFESRSEGKTELLKEAGRFIGMRMGTMFIEIFGMILLSSVWGMAPMLAKVAIQFVVVVLNYLFSKLLVFNLKNREDMCSEEEQHFRVVRKWCCIWGFVIPAVTMFIAFAVNKVFPFGDRGVTIVDSLHQYLPFFTNFYDKLEQGESLLYSFGGGLGFNFWAIYAYYLSSPLHLLIVFFPRENMMDVMALFIILKIGLCGLTMSYYLVNRSRGKNYYPIAFGVMYALCSMIIGYYFNLMWLESIAMLPLVMMGVERIVKGKDGRLFCLALFYGLFCNYYIGYMLCLFSCLYFLVLWISAKKITLKTVGISCVKFAWYALLAGGMAAIVLVPAYLGLGITESAENSFPETIKLFIKNLSQLTQQFAFVMPIKIADNQIGVNAFCSVVSLILVWLYLLNPHKRKRERIAKAGLLLLLVASFNVNALNFIWHGFHVQNGLPNRFSFVYIAMVVVMGFDVIQDLKYLSWKRIVMAFLIPFAFVGFSAITELGEHKIYVYLLTILLLTLYTVLLLFYQSDKRSTWVFQIVFITIIIIEMAAYSIFGVSQNGTVGRSTYLNDQAAYRKLMERWDNEEFFRSDIDNTRMRNSNMFFGANGVVLFSSTMSSSTVDLCKSLGIEARTNKNGYNGFTKLVNDIFGMKYVVSAIDSDSLYQMEKIDSEEPLNLYHNKGALSVGFMVDEAIKDWDILSSNDHLEIQNQFVRLATGEHDIFYQNQSIDMEDGVTYEIILPEGMQVYLDVTKAVEKIEITTPEYAKSYNRYNDHLYDLGRFHEATVATVTATFKENQEGLIQANVYVCSDERYQQVHEILAEEQFVPTHVSDGLVEGSITAREDGTLLFSIPYDKGWKISVDGENVEGFAVGGALMGIDITAGTHEIVMSYTSPGLWIGSFITFGCVFLYLLTSVVEKRRIRKYN